MTIIDITFIILLVLVAGTFNRIIDLVMLLIDGQDSDEDL